MIPSISRRRALGGMAGALLVANAARAAEPCERRLLYVAAPGIRNYVELGGAGILVFDVRAEHKFVKRIATPASEKPKPENIKGVCACAATKRLYFSTLTRLYCVDLVSEKTLWDKALPGGCDRMSITPDGQPTKVHVAKTTLNNKEVENCVVETIQGWELPPPGDVCEFSYTYNFEPE